MIMAIDMGNTNIVIGCIDNEKIYFVERLSTNASKTDLEYAIAFKNVLELYNIDVKQIEGAIISSVVPQLVNVIYRAVEKILGRRPYVVGPGLKTGLNILMDNPRQVGSDLICHDHFCGGPESKLYWRYDSSRCACVGRFFIIQNCPAAQDRSGSTEKMHW